MSLSYPLLTARLKAANKKLQDEKNKNNGLDMFDKALIGAVKFGLFAMFGLFVAAKMNNPKNIILPTISKPMPKATPKPKLP
jgi:hypothetical protein